MRQYTLRFMEHDSGARLIPVEGDAGSACFTAVDDDAAIAHIAEHFVERLKSCVRGELSSLRILPSTVGGGDLKLVDDSHENPHFQETHLKYDVLGDTIEVDFESTQTAVAIDLKVLRAVPLRGA